jgi:hypothetical protein
VLLSTLRRLAHEQNSRVTAVEVGLDGNFDRDDTQVGEVEALIVEGAGQALEAISVQPAPASGFSAFLDGIQRAEVRLYHGPIPIVYAYGAATVRSRVERRLVSHAANLLDEREAVFFPFRLLDPLELTALGLTAEQMVDTSPAPDQPLPLFPPALYAFANQAINRWREGIERSVARRWLQAQREEWLLADGTLTNAPELAASKRAVGLVKSHRTRFFDGDNARVLLGLRAGERTSVFEPQTRRWTPVHSWYLRLREPAGHDAFWGLVRAEIAAGPDSARLAEQISGWLLAELAPLTLPSASWDRLLYPIHECEQFLRARAPRLRS